MTNTNQQLLSTTAIDESFEKQPPRPPFVSTTTNATHSLTTHATVSAYASISTSVAATSVSTFGIPPLPAANVNAPAVQLRASPNRYLFGNINATETIYGNSVTTTTAMGIPVNSDNKNNHTEFVSTCTPPVSSAIDATAATPLKRSKQVTVTIE